MMKKKYSETGLINIPLFRMKKIVGCLVLFLLVGTMGYSQSSIAESVNSDSLVSFAKKHLGIKYHYANASPKAGFDCSGFVYYVFGHFNIKVPRASMDYENSGKIIPVDSSRAGDIIVFTGTNIKNRKPGHVGIIVSNTDKELIFIHSSSGHKKIGVILTNYKDSPYYQSRFIKVARLRAVN